MPAHPERPKIAFIGHMLWTLYLVAVLVNYPWELA